MWEQGSQNWNSNSQGPWKASCIIGSNKWVLTGSNSNVEYLGYCDSMEDLDNGELKFLEISKSDRKEVDISFCREDCWVKNDSSGVQQLESKKNEKWEMIKFYFVERALS